MFETSIHWESRKRYIWISFVAFALTSDAFCRLIGGNYCLYILFCIIIVLPVKETWLWEVRTALAHHKKHLPCNLPCTVPHRAGHHEKLISSLCPRKSCPEERLRSCQSCRAAERQIGRSEWYVAYMDVFKAVKPRHDFDLVVITLWTSLSMSAKPSSGTESEDLK